MAGMGGMAAALRVLVTAQGINQVNAQLAGVQGNLHKTGAKAGGMGAAMKKGLAVGAAAVGALGVALFKVGKEFDDAYDTIRVGTGKTGKALEGLKNDFKQVVKGVPTDFKSASTAIADLNTRLGLTGKPLQERAKQFLELSRITKTDVSTNIRTVTRAFGDWEVKTKDQAGTLDKFFRAAQSSGATVEQLADQVVKFGAPLRQVGFSLDEATAMFANFEKAGVNTQTMMPGLKQALGSFAKEGIDPKQGLTKAFKDIQSGAMDTEAAVKLFGRRAGTDMVEAVKQGRFSLDAMTKSLQNGDTIRKAGKDTMDFSEKWLLFKNKVLVALEPIAIRVFDGIGKLMEVLPPIADRVGGAIGALLSPFVSVGRAIGESKTAMVALGAATGVLLGAWAGFAIVNTIRTAIQGMVTAFWALNAAMAANPIGLVVVAIAALVAGLVVAYRESETFRTVINAVFSWFKGAVGAVFGFAKTVITTTWEAVSAVTSTVWNAIKGFLSGAFNAIKSVAATVFRAIGSVISTVWNAVSSVTSTVWNAIKSVLSTIWNAIRSAAGLAWEGIKTVIVNPVRSAAGWVGDRFDDLKRGLGVIWTTIKSAASSAWNAVKDNIINPVRSARDAVTDTIGNLFDRVKRGFGRIVDAASDFAGNVKDKIVGAFQGVAGTVTKFAIAILDVIDKIPGVDMKGTIKNMRANAKEAGYSGFARGGAYARTGGVVNAPMALMGEEAPRHPEFVIPTNPAYRSRAQGLLAQAAGAIGLAEGGVIDAFRGAIKQTGAGPKASLALWMAGIVESGLRNLPYGDRDSLGALQVRAGIHGRDLAMDPRRSALAFLNRGFTGRGGAIALSNVLGSAGQVAQAVQGSEFPHRYDQVRDQAMQYMNGGGGGGGGGLLGKIGGIVGDLLGKGADFLLSKLPGIGDLPDWLKGMGKHVLGKATGFIKDKVSGLIGGSDGGAMSGVGTMSGTNAKAAKLAKMFGATITSGYRSPARNAAAGGAPNSSHMRGSPSNPGAHDFVPASTALLNAALGMGAKWVDNHDYGSGYHSHVSWFKKGGIYGPVMGSYAQGTNYVPRDGIYGLHRGEAVIDRATNAAGSQPITLHVYLGDKEIRDVVKVEIEQDGRRANAAYRAGVA